MGLNWGGMAAAYQGAAAEQERLDDRKRRKEEDEQRRKELSYQDELRARQRTAWNEQDAIKAAEKADIAELDQKSKAEGEAAAAGEAAQRVAIAQEQVNEDKLKAVVSSALGAPPDVLPTLAPRVGPVLPGGAPTVYTAPAAPAASGPKLDPAVAEKLAKLPAAAGMPSPTNLNDTLDRTTEILRRKMARGHLSPEEYATRTGVLQRMKAEGVNDALSLMAQGRLDEGMERYNSVGSMRGAKIVKAEDTVTKINGEDVPTKLVTIRNADGSRTTLDVAKTQYQMLDLEKQLSHADRARTFQAQQKYQADTLQLQRDEAAARRRDAADARAIQRAALEASTPAGKIKAAEKALGRPLTEAERAAQIGIDTMPPAIRAQLTSLLKQQDSIAATIQKAQAEGTYAEGSPGTQALAQREAMLAQKVADLMQAAGQGGSAASAADPLGLNTPAAATPAAAAPAAAQPAAKAPAAQPAARAPVIAAPGGVRPTSKYSPFAIALGAGPDQQEGRNQMLTRQAAEIEAAAADWKAINAEFVAVAKRGDANANAAILPRVQAARQKLEIALDAAGASKNAQLLSRVGL